MQGYLKRGIQNPMTRGRFTKIIWMIQWIQTSGWSIKNSRSLVHLVQEIAVSGSGCQD